MRGKSVVSLIFWSFCWVLLALAKHLRPRVGCFWGKPSPAGICRCIWPSCAWLDSRPCCRCLGWPSREGSRACSSRQGLGHPVHSLTHTTCQHNVCNDCMTLETQPRKYMVLGKHRFERITRQVGTRSGARTRDLSPAILKSPKSRTWFGTEYN